MRRWLLVRGDRAWHDVLDNSFLLPEPEQVIWYGLCALTAILALLKLGGMLLLSWWWVCVPILAPFLALGALLVVAVILKLMEWVVS